MKTMLNLLENVKLSLLVLPMLFAFYSNNTIAASLVPNQYICTIGIRGSVLIKVKTDIPITKFHFVLFRPWTSTISNEQWGGFAQQIVFSLNNVEIRYGDKVLVWDDRYTMYNTIACK